MLLYYPICKFKKLDVRILDTVRRLVFQIMKQFRRKRCLTDKINRVRELLMTSRVSSSADTGSGSGSGSASSKAAAKDMDHVIGEMSLLQARTEMYFKFFRKRALVSFSYRSVSHLNTILPTWLCDKMISAKQPKC